MTLTPYDLAIRATGIGASEAWKIVTGVGSVEIWERLIEPDVAARREPVGIAAREGTLLEPLVADLYAEKMGAVLLGPLPTRRHERIPYVLATLDRVVIDASNWPIGIVECKRPKWPHREWGDPHAADPSAEIPRKYLIQCVIQMAVAELPWCDVAALGEGEDDVWIYRLTRDAELEGLVLESVERWWSDYVMTRTPPPPDGSSAASGYLQRRYPKSDDRILPADADADRFARAIVGFRKAAKAHEADAEALIQSLKARIGDAAGIEGLCTWKAPARGSVSWKSVAEELYALARQHRRIPDLATYADKFTSAPTRKFLLNRKITGGDDQ